MLNWHFDTSTLLFALSGLVALVVALINWRQRRQPGFAKLSMIMFLVFLWILVSGLELSVREPDAKMFFILIESTLISVFNTLLVPFVCEFLQYKWLTPPRQAILWVIAAFFIALEWTNSFHHLIWTEYHLNPANPDILLTSHGPLFVFDNAYLLLITISCILLLIFEMLRFRGSKSFSAGLIAASFTVPYLTYFGYLLNSDEILWNSLMPIGYSISGLLISWVVFEDLQRTVSVQTGQLHGKIQELEMEINNRKQLEQHLLEFHDSLAQQVSDQTQKLSGLYEMILLSGKSLPLQNVLEQSLERVRATLGSDLVCYYDLAQGLPASTFCGSGGIDNASLANLRFEWMGHGQDLIARVDGRIPDDLPEEVRRAGFKACTGKRVKNQDQNIGIFACFWADLHQFKVDEISLIGALSEELGVILENAQLRESASANATQIERRRLARELHDSVVQSLHSLVFAANTARQAAATSPEKLGGILDLISSSAQLALKEMRLLLFELRLIPSGEIQFLEGIQTRLDAVERRANIDAELNVESGTSWPWDWEKDLYAITMEALNNSLKHAQASRIEVHVGGNEQNFELKIMDNGRGFDPGTVCRGGMGLSTMTERAARMGGHLGIISKPGAGTLITMGMDRPVASNPKGSETI